MYAKVFRSLWDGTLGPDWQAWSVFVFLLAHADLEGFVDMTPQAISGRSGIPLEDVTRGLARLEAPDPNSRSQDLEGRRLERIDAHRSWGWRIVNYGHYRSLRDEETVRAQTRERVRQHRARSVTHSNAPSQVSNAPKRHAEVDVEADVEEEESNTLAHPAGERQRNGAANAEPNGNGHLTVKEWFLTVFWPYYPRKVGKKAAFRRVQTLFKSAGPTLEDALGNGIMNRLHDFKAGEWAQREMEHIPHPAVFLNREDFLDA